MESCLTHISAPHWLLMNCPISILLCQSLLSGWDKIHSMCVTQHLIKTALNTTSSSIDFDHAPVRVPDPIQLNNSDKPQEFILVIQVAFSFLKSVYWHFCLSQSINLCTAGCTRDYTDSALATRKKSRVILSSSTTQASKFKLARLPSRAEVVSWITSANAGADFILAFLTG